MNRPGLHITRYSTSKFNSAPLGNFAPRRLLESRISSKQFKMSEREVLTQNIEQSITDIEDLLDAIQHPSEATRLISEVIMKSLRQIKREIPNIDGPQTLGTLEAIYKVTSTSASALPEIIQAGDNWTTVLSGVLQMTEAFGSLVSSFFGPTASASGTIVTFVATLVNGMLSLFGNQGASTVEIFKRILEYTLRGERQENIENEAERAKTLFLTSKAILDGYAEDPSPIRRRDIDAIASEVPIYINVAFQVFLGTKIAEIAGVPNKDRSPDKVLPQSNDCVRYTSTYALLMLLQDALLVQMYTLIKRTGSSANIAEGILNVIEQRRQTAKSTLSFLNAGDCDPVILAIYLTEKNELKENVMTGLLGIPPTPFHLDIPKSWGVEGITISPVGNRQMMVQLPDLGTRAFMGPPGEQTKFFTIPREIYWAIQSGKWPAWYLRSVLSGMYVESVKTFGENWPEEVHFIVIGKNRESFFIAPRSRPDLFWHHDGTEVTLKQAQPSLFAAEVIP